MEIRSISKKIAILLDTKGPEVRTDVLEKPVLIKRGQKVVLSTNVTDPANAVIKVDYKKFVQDVKKGSTLLIDDGNIVLKVIAKSKHTLTTTALSTYPLGSRKSIVVPGVSLGLPEITHQDVKDLKFGVQQQVDIIALSLVRSAEAIKKVRNLYGKNSYIIAKIEHPDGVKNIDAIIREANGIMIARGDLGLNLPFEQVPKFQKLIIDKSIQAGKPVIVATQMLESMLHSPRPTRAEASDVANAVMQRADAVMLSGETAIGKFPLQAVRAMVKICEATEPITKSRGVPKKTTEVYEAIAKAVIELEKDGIVKAILSPTKGGFTPALISKYRPSVPIFALTTSEAIMRRLALVRGVLQFTAHDHKLLRDAIKFALENKMLTLTNTVAIVYGKHETKATATNTLELKTVGEILDPQKYHAAKFLS